MWPNIEIRIGWLAFMTRLNVKLFGVVGHNFGDEAIAVAATSEITRALPNAVVSVATTTHRDLLGLYGIREFRNHRRSADGFLELIHEIRTADVILIGGGTLLQDKLGLGWLRGNLAYALQVALLARFFKKKVGALAIGVDQLTSQLGQDMARQFLRLLDGLLVRDEQSLDLAHLYAGRRPGSLVSGTLWLAGADPAFLLDERGAYSPKWKFSNYLLVSLVNEGIHWDSFLDALATSVFQHLASGKIDAIVLLAMDNRPSEERSLFEAWLQKYPGLRDHSTTYVPNDVYDAARVIQHARIMVAARLHAMILGLGRVPFLAISRTTKTENFLEQTSAISIEVGAPISSALLNDMLDSLLGDSAVLDAQSIVATTQRARARTGIERLLSHLVSDSSNNKHDWISE